jgi:hypothetical protein
MVQFVGLFGFALLTVFIGSAACASFVSCLGGYGVHPLTLFRVLGAAPLLGSAILIRR